MSWLKVLTNYYLWLFTPKSILDSCNTSPIIKIPNWELVLFVSDPQDIKKINKATGKVFLGGKGNAFLGPLLGDQSVFLLDGEQHKLARSLIMKTIGSVDLVQQNKRLQNMIDVFVNEAILTKRLELTKANRWLTFQIIMSFVFPDPEPKFVKLLFKRIEKTTGLLANFVSYNKAFWFPTGRVSVGHIVKKMVKNIDLLIYQTIEKRKTVSTELRGNTLIDSLINEQTKYKYEDQFIRDNIMSVIAAGYDTTGSAISWLCFWLAKTPKRVLKELRLEAETQNTRQMPQISAFINESLRYCSPIEILPRKINKNATSEAQNILGDELAEKIITEDGLVSPCPYAAHRNSEIYHKPEEFDHTRFIGMSYKPHEFLPFGGGNRLCPGHILGTVILKKYLCTFLKQGKTLKLTRKMKYRPVRRNVSLWPAYKMNATVKEI